MALRIRSYSQLANKPTYITSPIFYVNGAPHLGHLHSLVLCDALHRWFKFSKPHPLSRFSTGTDEHGLKVQQAAEAAKVSPKEFCDRYSDQFRTLVSSCNADASFIRTTEPRHYSAVQHLWTKLTKDGYIYKGRHEGWYSVPDETFVPEIQTEVRGNGTRISLESGHVVEWMAEENYKFRLSQFTPKIKNWLESNPSIIQPENRYNEVMAFLNLPEITDLSISRLASKVPWSIPVPNDAEHSIYVWLDALTNYLTVAEYPHLASEDKVNLWPADYHVIGKDILKFHAIYWPAFLMAANLPLPKQIIAHSHWTVEKQKMSKSKGNVVDPFELLQTYGVDATRYFLLKEARLTDDTDFSREQLTNRLNHDLADQLGNLLSRATTPVLLPSQSWPLISEDQLKNQDRSLLRNLRQLPDIVKPFIEKADFHSAIAAITKVIDHANWYFFDEKPWTLKETGVTPDPARLNVIVMVAMETLRVTSLLLQCVMPTKTSEILDRLNVPVSGRLWPGLAERPDGRPLNASNTIIFPRFKQAVSPSPSSPLTQKLTIEITD